MTTGPAAATTPRARERRRVLVSHPGSTQPLFEMVGSVRALGYETRFVTGYHHDPNGRLARLVSHLPSALSRPLDRELRRRHSDAVSPDDVVAMAGLEFGTIGLARLLPQALSAPLRLFDLRNAVFDRLAAREIRRHRPDLVVTVDSCALRSNRAARESGAVAVLHQSIGHAVVAQRLLAEEARRHPDWADSMRTRFPRRLLEQYRLEALEADAILAPSNYVRATLREIGCEEARIRLLPYGVRTDLFGPGAAARSATDKIRILYVGQISQRKGLAYLLEAVKTLDRRDIEVVLIGAMVGAGAGLAPYRGFVRHIPSVPHRELPGLYRAADIFAYPSLHEGSAQAILEALASGLPAIVTPNAGSVVRDGVEGFVVPIRDVESLRQRISDLVEDESLRARLGAAARQRAEEHSWRHYRERLGRILADLLNPAP